MDAHRIEPTLRDVLRETLDAELGPDPLWAGSPAARRVAERQPRRWPLRAIAAAAAVLVVAVMGYGMLPGIVGPGASPRPSPVLIARGSFVEHDWGSVEFEAFRVGSRVTGRMTVAARDGWGPIAVDLQCTRETEDGIVMVGGFITVGNQIGKAGTPVWVLLKRGSPDRANIGSPLLDAPATQSTDCVASMDAWLQHYRPWIRIGGMPDLVLGGGVEFGP